MRTALGFVRASSVEQVKHDSGLETQRQRVRDYCEIEGLDLASIFEDPDDASSEPPQWRI
jgi:DNA invertase Pin-like site-specific DNA recombinase